MRFYAPVDKKKLNHIGMVEHKKDVYKSTSRGFENLAANDIRLIMKYSRSFPVRELWSNLVDYTNRFFLLIQDKYSMKDSSFFLNNLNYLTIFTIILEKLKKLS